MYQSLLSSFSAQVHTAKSLNLFKTFNSLLCPPTPPPTTSITADDFATFFTNKTTTISSQFSAPHIQELIQKTSTANTPLFSFCPLAEAEVSKLPLSSHPTTCLLDPIPSHLLQAIFHTPHTRFINNYPIKFALHNIRKIMPFLTEKATQLLLQALVISRLDYCNALLAGLPSRTIKPLQMIQNAAARLVFNEPKRAHNRHRLSACLPPLTATNLHSLQKSEIHQ
ncbi:C2 domain-containing protein 3 [Labeo rohita]|uniref:C2 domain-containing protein 3 n=1 Tax=Labeo rohita TaxID=84645 RepID=A0ABQ8LJJ8_LABRO|nr:C2 domain-containing protein 3 [Labeo rohita]